MTSREWLRNEINEELQAPSPADTEHEALWLGDALSLALADSGLSDRAIELLIEATSDAARPEIVIAHAAALAEETAFADHRQALGISVGDAAGDLDVAVAGYEALERSPLRWQNVDPTRAALYLARLGISPESFLRWLATLLPNGQEFAWGYRPGTFADQPLEHGDAVADRERLVRWGRAVLAVAPEPHYDPDIKELFGERWSVNALDLLARDIAERAHERILLTSMRSDVDSSLAIGGNVISLPAPGGVAWPAFQFGHDGTPLAIVVEINRLLGADVDPWGVAGWWLTVDDGLGARPVDLIGGDTATHEQLRRAVRAMLESD